MNEEEREIVKKFERLYLKDFNNEKITNEDRLSYIECTLMTNLIEKLQKENEELKTDNYELNNRITDLLENIPIQKIKDKIEEIQEEGYWLFTTDRDSDKCVEVLQQLLEKEQ